ncbi:hypothetical protein WN943_021873 [Citrus x changshan-huyou]
MPIKTLKTCFRYFFFFFFWGFIFRFKSKEITILSVSLCCIRYMVIFVALKAKFWLEKNCVLVLYLSLPSDQPRASDLSPVFTSKKLGGKKK